MYKEDLALNNLQWWICHKTQPNLYIVAQKTANKIFSRKGYIVSFDGARLLLRKTV